MIGKNPKVKGDALDKSAPHSFLSFRRVLVGNILGVSISDRHGLLRRRVWQSLLNRLNAFQHIFGKIHVEAVDIHLQLFHGGRTNNV